MNGSNTDLSVFNGVQNNALPTQEEEEATEDIRRRQEELQILIKNVLDEYDYEESTLDSTTNVSMDEAQNANYSKHSVTEESQIRMLYQARVEEIHALKEELENVKSQLEEATRLNTNRQALCNSELQQCKISLQQSQELLVEKSSELAHYQMQLQSATNEIETMQTELDKLKDNNTALKSCNEELRTKIHQMEHDGAFSTNKVTERELHAQYVEQISYLEHQVNEWKTRAMDTEENNAAVIEQLQNTIQEKNDKLAEQNKHIVELQTTAEELRSQCHLYMNLLEQTKTEYSKFKAETKGARDLLELMKDGGPLSRFTDIPSTINSMRQKLDEKEEELKATKKNLKNAEVRNVQLEQDFNKLKTNLTTEVATNPHNSFSNTNGNDLSSKHCMLPSEENMRRDSLNKRFYQLTASFRDKEKELYAAYERIEVLTAEFEHNKKIAKEISDKFKYKNERLLRLVQKLQAEKMASNNEKQKLNCKLLASESEMLDLRDRIAQERERNENIVSLLNETNKCVQEVARQLGTLQDSVKETKMRILRNRERLSVGLQTDNTIAKMYEGAALLQCELQLREQMQQDFKNKLDSIENKYKVATAQKCNYDELKQQVLRLTAKLHKYKSLYDGSRKAMMEYLMVSSEQVKYLEKKIYDVEQQKFADKVQLDECRKKLQSSNHELVKHSKVVKQQAKAVTASWKQILKLCQCVTAVRDKAEVIMSDQQISQIEAEYQQRQQELNRGVSK